MGERRGRLDDVLTVVQNQERFALADRGDEPVRRFRVRCAAEQRIPEPERGERRLRHVTVRADSRELHQPGPVRQVAEQRARGLRGQPGLPPASPGPIRVVSRWSMMSSRISGDISVLADAVGELGAQVGLPALLPPARCRPCYLAPQQRGAQCGQLRVRSTPSASARASRVRWYTSSALGVAIGRDEGHASARRQAALVPDARPPRRSGSSDESLHRGFRLTSASNRILHGRQAQAFEPVTSCVNNAALSALQADAPCMAVPRRQCEGLRSSCTAVDPRHCAPGRLRRSNRTSMSTVVAVSTVNW